MNPGRPASGAEHALSDTLAQTCHHHLAPGPGLRLTHSSHWLVPSSHACWLTRSTCVSGAGEDHVVRLLRLPQLPCQVLSMHASDLVHPDRSMY